MDQINYHKINHSTGIDVNPNDDEKTATTDTIGIYRIIIIIIVMLLIIYILWAVRKSKWYNDNGSIEQTGDIFKLDIDCFLELFDYLSSDDLISLSQTCRQMQGVVGYCFQGYSMFRGDCMTRFGVRKYFDMDDFIPFREKLEIHGKDGFKSFFNVRFAFRQLKEIIVKDLSKTDMARLKGIPSSKLQVLSMKRCDLNKNFHEIIDQFTKLKSLDVKKCSGGNQWLNRKYPTLEYFGFVPSENESIQGESIQGIPVLLELNPNIRKFMTTAEFLLENRDKFTSSSVKLDDLDILINYQSDLSELCDLLNELHGSDFYKKLKLNFFDFINQEMINQSATAKGLVVLHVEVYYFFGSIKLSALENLEELYLAESKLIDEIEMVATEFTHLRSIHFEYASITNIVPFVERSANIQIIKVDRLKGAEHWFRGHRLRGEEHFDEKTQIIDLNALNKERKLLPGARKITMYVKEEIYLATKWAMNGNDFEKIRLRWLED